MAPRLFLLASAALLLAACRDSGGIIDVRPPRLTVHSPSSSAYDTNGDQLVDFDIEWHGVAKNVDQRTASVRSLDGIDGPAGPLSNLLDVWTVTRRDSIGIAFHETIQNLLKSGINRLEISVADSAGNRTTDTVVVVLPHGVFWKTVSTGLTNMVERGSFAVDTVMRRLYMAHSNMMVVFNLDSLNIIAKIPPPVPGLQYNRITLSPPDGVCMTELLRCLDPATWTWGPDVNSARAIALASSRVNSDLIYLGETYSGVIGIYSKSQHARIGEVGNAPNPYQDEFIDDIVLLAGDRKLYATQSFEGGLVALDPHTGTVLARVPGGDNDGLVLTRDETRLYAGIWGLTEIDTRTDRVTRQMLLTNALPINIALSPDERFIFQVTQEPNPGQQPYSKHYLIDVDRWIRVDSFPRPRAAGQIRYDRGAVFHPNGKLVFQAHDLDLDVYLIRK